jgi:penicillin amidase/acyl-homoserine-lactone acylase
MNKGLFKGFIALVIVGLLVSCQPPLSLDAKALLDAGKKHDVRILRDTWGVPHVFGATDADAAYGLAYAHAEDDFATIQETFMADRAALSSVKGREMVPLDYFVHLFRIRETVDAKYEHDLSPEMRAVCEAYAEGVNLYAALHPKEVVKPGLFPATGKDVVAGFVEKVPLFFGLDHTVRELFAPNRKHDVPVKSPTAAAEAFFTHEGEIGSNAFAVGPKRSADGKTRLAVNSHQPWTGPVAWYEAHLHSGEGMDIVGGTFPGSPIILHGHNRNLGWAHTVNLPDLADVYVLEINPDNPNQYKFDGQWRDLEVRQAKIAVRVFGPFRWTFTREALWSVYGPVVRRPHGVYAIRYAGQGEIRQIEQWYRMGKARDFAEWLDAVRMRAIPSFNICYADREGTIYYLYNALLPLRAPGYDWKQYLPGNTSETLWTDYLPFDKLPQIKNPASGFVITCNNTPFRTTIGPENPKPENYAPSLGIDTMMTNRALRALELFGGDDSITEEEFYAYKYDLAYSKEGIAVELLKKIIEAPPSDDPVVNEAVAVLRAWDLRTNADNTGTAIAVLTMEPIVRAMIFGYSGPDPMTSLKEKAHLLKDTYGRIDVPWEQVNRIRRGTIDVGTSGGPDVLHAISGKIENGRLIANNGDSYILLAAWDKKGNVSSRSIHQFGSATMDEKSPHYADQVPLFVACKTKPVWMDEADIRANLEREYRPGEPPTPPPPPPTK